jgi:hypothetical protein
MPATSAVRQLLLSSLLPPPLGVLGIDGVNDGRGGAAAGCGGV